MTIALTNVTGGTQVGASSPVMTVASDTPPSINGKAWVVTGLTSGTFANMRFHAVSDPCSIVFTRPASPRALPNANPITARYPQIPVNQYQILVKKGVNYAANQAPAIASARVIMNVPAGADAYDPANVRAMLSLLIGALAQVSSGLGDTAVSAVL